MRGPDGVAVAERVRRLLSVGWLLKFGGEGEKRIPGAALVGGHASAMKTR